MKKKTLKQKITQIITVNKINRKYKNEAEKEMKLKSSLEMHNHKMLKTFLAHA